MPILNIPNEWSPRAYQQPAWDYLMQDKPGLRSVVVAHRRYGKDSIGINVMAAKAMAKPGLYYYMAPTQKHARKIIWDNIGADGKRIIDQAFPKEIRTAMNGQDMRIDLVNGSIFQVLGSDNYDSIVGSNPSGIVFSEWAIADKPEAWDYLRPILLENGGWAMFIYTPRGMNHGYKIYRTALSNPKWYCELATIDDTGRMTEEDIQGERDDGMSEANIQQEFYCKFLQDTDRQVFSTESILAAQGRAADTQDKYVPLILGVDCARFGSDRSVLSARIGNDMRSIPLAIFEGLDSVELAGKIADFDSKYHPDAIFIDETGQGAGVVDACKHIYHLRVVGINFGARALRKEVYKNIRAEMHDKMATWLNEEDAVLPLERGLMEEMSTIPWKEPDPMGRLQVESKEKIKKETGMSPDITDAMILTFARPVMRKDTRNRLASRGQSLAVMD